MFGALVFRRPLTIGSQFFFALGVRCSGKNWIKLEAFIYAFVWGDLPEIPLGYVDDDDDEIIFFRDIDTSFKYAQQSLT